MPEAFKGNWSIAEFFFFFFYKMYLLSKKQIQGNTFSAQSFSIVKKKNNIPGTETQKHSEHKWKEKHVIALSWVYLCNFWCGFCLVHIAQHMRPVLEVNTHLAKTKEKTLLCDNVLLAGDAKIMST